MMARHNIVTNQIKQLSSTSICASCAALMRFRLVGTGLVRQVLGRRSTQKPDGFVNAIQYGEWHTKHSLPSCAGKEHDCSETTQQNRTLLETKHHGCLQRNKFPRIPQLPVTASSFVRTFFAPNNLPQNYLDLRTSSDQRCLNNTGQNFSLEYFARSLHTSSASCRKRKNKSSRSSVSPSDEVLDTGEEIADEEHEYADEAYEYANELVERGYQTVQGHRVLIIQPILKNQPKLVQATECDLMLAEAKALVQVL